MVELTVEKILLISIGLVFALLIGFPLILNVLEMIKLAINGVG
ncbi:MAG: hypothetical protein ACFFCM_13115 [Promethearchaeota archaeon]